MTTKQKPYKVTPSSLIIDILNECPHAVALLEEYEFYCVTCFITETETLQMAAKNHGMTKKELEMMLKEINQELQTV
jgi:hypothetical protein